MLTNTAGLVGINGWNFNTSTTTPATYLAAGVKLGGVDISDDFDQSSRTYSHCTNATAAYVTTNLCTTASGTTCALAAPTTALFKTLGLTNTTYQVGYSWDQVGNLTDHMVLNGNVLNLTPYMLAHPTAIAGDAVDTAIRYVLGTLVATGGKDGTRLFANRDELKGSIDCLSDRYYAGHIDKVSPGCMVSHIFLYCSLALICTIILVRFVMAVIFAWILSARLVKPPRNLKRKAISPAVMPEGANIDITNTTGAAPWINDQQKRQKAANALAPAQDGMISMASIGAELFCVCLVTCYSEGEDGIRTTLDSIAGTTYSDARKLIFVVCDGMITGEGEKKSTPDICVGLIEADPRFGEPIPMSYVAIADGSKKHNQAMVYAGHYSACLLFSMGTSTLTQLVCSSQCARPPHADGRRRQVRPARGEERQEAREPRQARLADDPHELLLARDVQRPHDAARLRPLPQDAEPHGRHARLLRGLPHGECFLR